DLDRDRRIGLDEALLCAGKTVGQIATILETVAERGRGMLLTRLLPEVYAALPQALQAGLDYEPISATAFFGALTAAARTGQVAVVGAGTSDMRVCREA